MATLFRGYEVILKGRDPRDASLSAAVRVAFAVACTPRARRSPSKWRLGSVRRHSRL